MPCSEPSHHTVVVIHAPRGDCVAELGSLGAIRMPVTPFHFGPGAAVLAVAPKHVSILAFCASNVLMDMEPLYYMLTYQFPLHRFFHSYLGATAILIATITLFVAAIKIVSSFRLANLFNLKQITARQIAAGAALGSYSHIVFDSVMHADIQPLLPFSESNPLLRAVSLNTLHWACIASGIVGLIIIGIRWVLRAENEL